MRSREKKRFRRAFIPLGTGGETAYRPTGCLRNNRGFTFIEMIVALTLIAILSAVFGMGLVAAMQSFDFSRANGEVVQKGQMAMARITRELSEATDVVNINSASDPFIIYERIEETDGVPSLIRLGLHYNSADRSVRLYRNPPDPMGSGTLSQGRVLVDDVQTFSLQYYIGPTAVTWPFDPRLLSTMQIALTLIRPDAPDRSHRFATVIHLRNNQNPGGAQ